MQRVVNHIYWSNHNFFANGTSLRVSSKLSVDFENNLMAPGKAVITWGSAYNYQGTKTVPQLPMLRVGHQYRIVLHLTSVPDHTYLIRLTFNDLQGTVIKKEEFRSEQRDFVFPVGTVSYSLEIINAGLTSFHLGRVDICESSMPIEVNSDIWVHKPVNFSSKLPLNVILVRDSKQSRKTYPVLQNLMLPVQVIGIGWQYQDDLVSYLNQWLSKQQLTNVHIISTDSSLDNIVLQVKEKCTQAEVMTTNACATTEIEHYTWNHVPVEWTSPDVTEPDWDNIMASIKDVWGEVII